MARRLSEYIAGDDSFARSTNLRYDFHDVRQVERYIPTTKSAKLLKEILAGILSNSSDRSRVVSGPYGSGKSAFALFLSAFLRRDPKLDRALRQPLSRLRKVDPELWQQAQAFGCGEHRSLVVVVNQDEGGLLPSIHKALCQAFRDHSATRRSAGSLIRQLGPVRKLRSSEDLKSRLTDLLGKLNQNQITDIFFIFDEFGKFLERFALEPDGQSLFLLQTLSEMAARPQAGKLHLLLLLHLSFSDYAQQLPLHMRNEWAKVEGRFRQLSFVEDSDQVYQLISEALSSRTSPNPWFFSLKKKWATKVSRQAGVLPAFQQRLAIGNWRELFVHTYPLHPVALFALPRLSARLGQNERTLYTYLAGKEPRSLGEFLASNKIDSGQIPVVTLDRIFDYFSDYALRDTSTTVTKRWAEIVNCLQRTEPSDEEAHKVIKAIGALTILNVPRQLPCTEEVLRFALDKGASDSSLSRTLQRLVKTRQVVFRKYSGEYHLWQGSDIDFPAEIEKQKSLLRSQFKLEEFLQREIPPSPIAAQRYYDEYHTLRYFEGRHVSLSSLPAIIHEAEKELAAGADGFILYVMCESKEEIQKTLAVAEDSKNKQLLFAIPKQPIPCRETALELAAIYALQTDAAFVQSDPIVRRELAELADVCTQRLRSLSERATDPYQESVHWISAGGNKHELHSMQSLKQLVSGLCRAVFPYTPRINNELINRKRLTSTAAAARKKLVTGLFEQHGHPTLGLTGFGPEMAVFRSVLVRTGWYTKQGKRFLFTDPPAKTNIPRVMEAIARFLGNGREKKNAADLLAHLQRPPYGIRPGLASLFLAVFLTSHRKTTAILENGVYVRDFGADAFERFFRLPELFELQAVPLDRPHQAYLDFLRKDLCSRLKTDDVSKDPVRNVLTLLYHWVHGLPKFCLQTEKVSPETKTLREALLNAGDPVKLLFTDFPQSLGFGEGWSKRQKLHLLCRATRRAFDELSDAYSDLLQQVETTIRRAFRLTGRGNVRSLLSAHINTLPSSLEDFVLDTGTLTFIRRARSNYPTREAWLESVAGVLTSVPLHSWDDSTFKQFEVGLLQVRQQIASGADLSFSAVQAGLRPADKEHIRIRVETVSGKVFETIVPIARAARIFEELSSRASLAFDGNLKTLFTESLAADTMLDDLQSLTGERDSNERGKPN